MQTDSKKKILIVDDCSVVVEQLSDEFRETYEVTTARSGAEAVRLLEDPVLSDTLTGGSFDLIITDFNMPKMDGLELSRYIRSRNIHQKFTPVVLLTSEEISKEEARKNGCIACFSKANRKQLQAIVRVLISA